MIEPLAAPAPHVVAFRLEGQITADDVGRAIRLIETRLQEHEPVSLIIEVGDVKAVTVAAMVEDLRHGLGQIRHLGRYHRVALVAAQGWLRAAAQVEGAVLPGVEVRAFTPAEQIDATAWASAPRPDRPAPVAPLDGGPQGLVAFAIQGGPVTRADTEAVFARIRDAAGDAAHDADGASPSVDLLVRLDRFPRPGADLFSLDLLADKLDAMRHVRRLALVGGPDWLASVARSLNPLLQADVRAFDAEPAAREWLDG